MKLSRRKFIRNMSLGFASISLNANTLAKNSGGSEATPNRHPKATTGYHYHGINLEFSSSNKNLWQIMWMLFY